MQRLPNTPEGETKPIGFRLPPPTLAMIDREVAALRAGVPEAAAVGITRSAALRALLTELEQRRAADPTSTSAPPLPRASLARIVAVVEGAGAELRALLEGAGGDGHRGGQAEVQRVRQERRTEEQVGPRGAGSVDREVPQAGGERAQRVPPVAHTAAGGQLSLLTRTANDGAEEVRPHPMASVVSRPENGPASAEVLAELKPRLVAAIAAGQSAKAIARGADVDAASLTRWLSGARSSVSVGTARKLGAYLANVTL